MAVNNTDDVVRLIWKAANTSEAASLRENIRVYRGDCDDLVSNKLKQMFKDEAVRNRLIPLISTEINLCRTIVDQTAMVYRQPATREAMIGETPDSRYADIVKESRIDSVMQAANRYTRLVNHVLIRPVMRKGRMEYDIILPDQFELYTDINDWKEVVAVKYYVGDVEPTPSAFMAGQTVYTRKRGFIWVKKDAYLSHDGTVIKLGAGVYEFDQTKANEPFLIYEFPYQINGENVLPFVLTYKEYPIECLLNFSQDASMPDTALMVMVLLTYLNEVIKYQSFVQLAITGETDMRVPDNLQSGPGTIYKLLATGGTADIKAVDVKGPITELTETIMRRVQMICAQYGIPPSALTMTGTPQSGYAMKMDRSALEELRKYDVGIYRDVERELFEVTRAVNNTDGKGAVPAINEAAEFHIDFAEPEFAPSPQEEATMWNGRIAQNVATAVDWIKADNPDLDDDEAMELYLKNKAINNPNANVMPLTVPPAADRTKPVMPVDDEEDNDIAEDDGK